jgi:two-component system, cell cycle sensor histidine kinase and response regulator CckA
MHGPAGTATDGGYAGAQADVTKRRILVADDDAQMRAVIRDLLEPLQATIEEASTGLELLELLADGGPFDLVITDVRMPAMSGLQTALAARNAGYDMPFIVISAFGDAALQTSVNNLRNAVFLDKPFNPRSLLQASREALAARH